ncbi:MAG: hypothetical protein QXP60_05795 [Nitrososphaerota archaeon]
MNTIAKWDKIKKYITKRKAIPMKYIEKFWDELEIYHRDFICKQKLDIDFIKRKWKTLTEWQRILIYYNNDLPESFINSIWDNLNDNDKRNILLVQKLSQPFIEKIWPELKEYQRTIICKKQKLNLDFIKKVWKQLTIQQKKIIKNRDPLIKFVVFSL